MVLYVFGHIHRRRDQGLTASRPKVTGNVGERNCPSIDTAARPVPAAPEFVLLDYATKETRDKDTRQRYLCCLRRLTSRCHHRVLRQHGSTKIPMKQARNIAKTNNPHSVWHLACWREMTDLNGIYKDEFRRPA